MPNYNFTKIFSLILLVALPEFSAGQGTELVDVGGYRLEFQRTGSGNPTIILVGGLGNELETWSGFIPLASKLSTVIAYSRSGLGRSQQSPDGNTAQANVAELHKLIIALHVKPPVILIGASYGSILVRLYTSLYPDEVGGLVIIDGSHEQQVKRWGKIDSTYPASFKKFFEDKLKTLSGAVAEETRESMRIQEAGSVLGMKPLPDIPIAVLTSMKVDPNPQYVNQSAAGHEAWREMHEEWVRRSHNALHIVTRKSGHHIQEDEPLLVVDAIKFVIDRLRSN